MISLPVTSPPLRSPPAAASHPWSSSKATTWPITSIAPSPFLLLGVKPSLHLHHIHLYHKGCHQSHQSLQGNHFPNLQILLGNHMKYHISSLLLHALLDLREISIGELFNGWG